MRSAFAAVAAAILAAACSSDVSPDGPDSGSPDSGSPDSGSPDSGSPDSGSPDSGSPDSGSPDGGALQGCGAGGGGAHGGPGDLFPCDSPWYRDVSAVAPSSQSGGIISAISGKGGFGHGGITIVFDFHILHADGSAPLLPVNLRPHDANDQDGYYNDESDTLLPRPTSTQGLPVPTPADATLEGLTPGAGGLTCPTEDLGVDYGTPASPAGNCTVLTDPLSAFLH